MAHAQLTSVSTTFGSNSGGTNLIRRYSFTCEEKSIKPSTLRSQEDWYIRHRGIFTNRFILKLVLGCLALQLLPTLVIQYYSQNFALYPQVQTGNCVTGWEFIPVYTTSLIYVFILCPIMIIQLHGFNDVYGIKHELMSDFVVGSIAFLLYAIFAVSPSLKNVIKVFPAAHWSVLALMVSHIFSIVIPTIQAIRSSTEEELNDNNPEFECILEDPEKFEVFQKFCVSNFTVETTRFYERCIKFRTRAERMNLDQKTDKTLILDGELITEIQSIYEMFIAPSAAFPIQIDRATARQIAKDIFSGTITLEIFDLAVYEVRQQMLSMSFSQFSSLNASQSSS
ncbi:hypothetical protein K493DRAFT_301833 [Basidiobolus meristosporus CBS 931.73]|uniref:RGS domain-containing protein n=1 Tax=Basidiobolus meristosporus CBS 931.73 TaxID=1314790 RepID=A0A1Y1Y9W8_9FUNG|nr:hypothetical protein K493DRAFT_301833 [Basidiobolus meristosporus CBS 931.73]|eukprot:ORX94792.1 hypothetical protein K493DRAFT_301833 [Basidiobolus meristosporus CBS 931.73]